MALVGNGLNLAYEPLYHIIHNDYPELFSCPEVFETDGQFRLLEGQSVYITTILSLLLPPTTY